MRVLLLTFGITLVVPQAAWAGALYGTVRMARQPVADAQVSVACPSFERAGSKATTVSTDKRGSFSLRVPGNGRCEMRVARGNRTGKPFDVFVSDKPLRFDFEIDSALNRER